VADDYEKWFRARLRAVDAALQRDPAFLCAGRFTAADVAVGYAVQLAGHLGLDRVFSEPVQRYWAALRQRPAFRRALQAQHDAALEQGVPVQPAPDLRP
jgi:glutathione S-transferase